ncbi:efflux RND transporter periplasmic adaptor subunit [Paraglaciecola aquimarina]|uniref:Efflux RND transporter periplasmic adaptor subunit n=1 Tax=Paraglaciecola aquimarina TaxID=1235557 RepID=A0ABU3SVZ8_9ALTE|nr:efflux RND transporter periplasmic adaptor subunit [Paraglaciecola aquimarina]MDU0354174.1 efflux RND transporter periplasmic adaptor subunit [Paraglaciecola aquimarina]
MQPVARNMLVRKLIKWLVAPGILLFISLAVVNWLDSNKPQPNERPTRVKLNKVFVHESIQASTSLKGHSQGQMLPTEDLEIRSEVTGKIEILSDNLVNGGKVTKGELLVQIDQSDYLLEVIQRQSRVAQAEQQLAKVTAETESAQRELADLGRKNPSSLARGIPQLKQAEASLEAAKADLAIAKLALKRTQIFAPFDGRVEKETLTKGQYLNRGGVVAKIHGNDVMEVRLAMNAEQFTQIGLPLDYYSHYQDSKFDVNLTAQVGQSALKWHAKIIRVEAAIDSQTRSLYAVAEVHSQKGQQYPLLKGLFVNAEITGQLVDNVTELPKLALRSNEQLWVVDENNQLKVEIADIVQRKPDSIIVRNLPDHSLVIVSALAIPTSGMPIQPLLPNGQIARKRTHQTIEPIRKKT